MVEEDRLGRHVVDLDGPSLRNERPVDRTTHSAGTELRSRELDPVPQIESRVQSGCELLLPQYANKLPVDHHPVEKNDYPSSVIHSNKPMRH